MQKLLLVSIMAGIIALPAIAARDPRPARALKKVLFWIAGLDVAYYLAIRFVYPYLF
jgi:hypothetical protein